MVQCSDFVLYMKVLVIDKAQFRRDAVMRQLLLIYQFCFIVAICDTVHDVEGICGLC